MDWPEISASIGAGVGAAVVALCRWLSKRKGRKEESRNSLVMDNARRYVHLYGMAQEWMSRHGAQRVLLLYAKNTGTPWDPQAPVKVSCVLQTVLPDNKDTFDRWQEWVCDSWYRSMLSQMMVMKESQQTGIRLQTDMNVQGVLKDAYASQGTVSSVVFEVLKVPSEYGVLYVSLNFAKPGKSDKLINNPEAIRQMMVEGRTVWEGKR